MSRSSLHSAVACPHFHHGVRGAKSAGRGNEQDCDVLSRVPALAPFQVRSFRFQWPADLLASWAFEMEGVILDWFVLVSTGSVLALAVFGSLQFLGTLISPLFGMAGDRIGNRNLLCLMRATYIAVATALAALFLPGRAAPVSVFALATVMGLVRPSDITLRNLLVGETMPASYLMRAMGVSRTTAELGARGRRADRARAWSRCWVRAWPMSWSASSTRRAWR